MNLIYTKILSCLLIFIVPLIAGFLVFKLKKHNKALMFASAEAFSCGIFLGAGLLHMLVHALNAALLANISNVSVMLTAGSAFLSMLLLEHIGRYFIDHNQKFLPLLACLILSLHSVSAGVALGMANSAETIMVVLVAILSHKWAAGFALAILLVKHLQNNAWSIYTLFLLMTPLGILLGQTLMPFHDQSIGIYAHAFAAGTFLYIGTLHGLKQAVLVDRCCDLKAFIWVPLGFILMSLVS